MTIYDNNEFIPPIFLKRIDSTLPAEFTSDIDMEYISAYFEYVFIVPEDGNYTFYGTNAVNSIIEVRIQGKTYYQAEQETSFEINTNKTYTTGDALYFEIFYQHKTGPNGILLQYENLNDGTGTLYNFEGDSVFAPQQLQSSTFKIDVQLNILLIEFSSSNIIFVAHNDPNTKLDTTVIQVGLVNTIRLEIKDIYGNVFKSGSDVTFYMDVTPEGYDTEIYTSAFNYTSGYYEFYINPTLALPTVFKIYEILTLQELNGSPVTIDVLAGLYNPNKFELTESYDIGV